MGVWGRKGRGEEVSRTLTEKLDVDDVPLKAGLKGDYRPSRDDGQGVRWQREPFGGGGEEGMKAERTRPRGRDERR